MWLQLYNYKNYIRLINVGLGYNRFYINITTKFILICFNTTLHFFKPISDSEYGSESLKYYQVHLKFWLKFPSLII